MNEIRMTDQTWGQGRPSPRPERRLPPPPVSKPYRRQKLTTTTWFDCNINSQQLFINRYVSLCVVRWFIWWQGMSYIFGYTSYSDCSSKVIDAVTYFPKRSMHLFRLLMKGCLPNVGLRFLIHLHAIPNIPPTNWGLSNCNAIHQGAPPHRAKWRSRHLPACLKLLLYSHTENW